MSLPSPHYDGVAFADKLERKASERSCRELLAAMLATGQHTLDFGQALARATEINLRVPVRPGINRPIFPDRRR